MVADEFSNVARLLAALDEHVFTVELGQEGPLRPVTPGPAADWLRALSDDASGVSEDLAARLRRGEPAQTAYRLPGDGRLLWLRARTRRGPDGCLLAEGLLSALPGEQDLRRDGPGVDGLTGVLDRTTFRAAVEDELERAGEWRSTPGLILLGLDRLGHVNHVHGRAAGDEALADCARRLTRRVRGADHVGRWAGGTFAVLVRNIADDSTLRRIAEGLCASVETDLLTASVGAARPVGGVTGADALLDAAERAVAAARRRGGNNVRLAVEVGEDDLVAEDPEAVHVAQTLALATSIREGMPYVHCQQVADLSVHLAERLGAPPRVVLRSRLGGWLHDVGKIAIPDRVLIKAGPLEPEEWELMKQHTVIGDQIVRRVAGVSEASGAVRSHHERWDGSGYPDRLEGPAIPLEARIVAVTDAYSAITSPRVHQAARSQDEATSELRRSAGTHLDPTVVDALCEALSEGVGVSRRPGDPSQSPQQAA
jgi:diguanylate cyclase (GGDEF)-like protein/putative nucleotidyltransferase with HDIG domain